MVFTIKLILSSILGSLIAYFGVVVFPSSEKEESRGVTIQKRINNWKKVFSMDKRSLVVDVVFTCGLIGIGYTFYILKANTEYQAFLGGLTAEACLYHFIQIARNKIN